MERLLTALQPLRAFRKAAPSSQLFNTRLIELVAVAMHQIGTLLYQLELRMHDGDIDRIGQWCEELTVAGCRFLPPATLFSHHGYLDHDLYPDGVADVVGYWAEDRILGGVAVFDRQAEQLAPQSPPNVHFHSCRLRVTDRYYQLRDDQQHAMLDCLLADGPDPSAAPFPILADDENVVRVNQEQAVVRQLYRDIWERKLPTSETLDLLRRRPQSTVDYPEYNALIAHINTLPTYDILFPSGLRSGATGHTSNKEDGGGGGETSELGRKRKRENGLEEDRMQCSQLKPHASHTTTQPH